MGIDPCRGAQGLRKSGIAVIVIIAAIVIIAVIVIAVSLHLAPV